jgi:tRNA-dihydrouridine synthase
MPFVPEIREKMMGSTLQQYKEQLERIVKRINELPSA